jgi:cysteine desulfurase / selenocysteine lyase
MNVEEIRDQFPILRQTVNGKPLVYLDSAASAQVPQQVLDAFTSHYAHDHANIHRGIHTLAERSTEKFENARAKIADFINASPEEIIFTKGTTESVNLIAYTLLPTLNEGDEIVVTEMDHHSNFVIWQQLAAKYKLNFKIIPITPDFRLDMESARHMITERTRVVAAPHVSNVLGSVVDIKTLAALAHDVGALMIVDGAQAIAHTPVDVKNLDVDMYTFSGHKLYATTGVGVLYMKKSVMQSIPPFLHGGGMISEVTCEQTTFQDGPAKFEAGTQNISGVICLAAAIDFLNGIGMSDIAKHEQEIVRHTLKRLAELQGIALIGPVDERQRMGVFSLVVENIHAHDVAQVLDKQGIAVRAGHHCAQPLAARYKIPATVRCSIGVYTTKKDIDAFIRGLEKAKEVFL